MSHKRTLLLNGNSLTPKQVNAIVRGDITEIRIDPAALRRVRETHRAFERTAAENQVYGLHTGFGSRATVLIDQNTDRYSSIVNTGSFSNIFDFVDPSVSKAVLAIKANSFLAGGMGAVRPELIEKLVEVFNDNNFRSMPNVPALGTGEGDLNSSAILAKWWLDKHPDFHLAPGEDLALLAGNDYCDALMAVTLSEIRRLMDISYSVFGASMEGYRAQPQAIAPQVAEARPSNSLRTSIKCINGVMKDSRLLETGARNLQDPNSFRTFPQVMAAVENYTSKLEKYLQQEMNSATQNPYYSADSDQIIHNGNFDTTYSSVTLSALQLALAKHADISFKRLSKMCDPHFNGRLVPGLSRPNSLADNIQSLNVTNIAGQALKNVVGHARQNITDASSLQFQNGIEDSVSGVFQQLLDAQAMVKNIRLVMACELVVAMATIQERIRDGDIVEGDLSPHIARIYENFMQSIDISRTTDRSGMGFDLDQVTALFDNRDIFPPTPHLADRKLLHVEQLAGRTGQEAGRA
ncbi:MAG TPA: aromatic amino acid lyase [Rickettsiales bacterium]|nr:aromatic amino acid lyase [Rickettsiales bacterium]